MNQDVSDEQPNPIEEMRKKRFQFLHKLYELSGGNELIWYNMWKIGEELKFDRELTEKIYQFLAGEYLIEATGLGGNIGITHYGVANIEEALSNPTEPTPYFPPVNIIYVGQMTNSVIQQAGNEAVQTITIDENNYNELKEILKTLKESIDKLGLEEEEKSELDSDIETINSQLKSPKPKKKIIHESLVSVKRILEGAAGGVIAGEILSRIIPLLGG